jgi:hypothetical protein
MAKKVKGRLVDDISASLNEALKYARGEKADVIVHRVVPRDTTARKARTLIEVIKNEPKAVRRAIAKRNSAA